MANHSELRATGVIEKDQNNDVQWTWSYPSVSAELRNFLITKSGLSSENPLPVKFVYGRWKEDWYYMLITEAADENSNHLSKVLQIALVLISKDFNPEQYATLCRVFCRQYMKSANAADILVAHLSVTTRGTCNSEENGKFSISDYSKQQAYAKNCVKEIIHAFGVETILLYTAVLLKKRIVIYFPPHALGNLLDYTRSIPAFAWHRQNWSIVYPWVHLTEAEIGSLQSTSHYVAGFTEAAVEGRTDLYDVFVNASTNQITVASHSKESLAMGKLHKDIAMLMVEKAGDDSLEDIDVVKEIAAKTKDLLNNLKSLAVKGDGDKLSLTLETLKERKMPPATENFLFSLAASEGFVKL